MAAVLALASAATFGVADFLGGLASRRAAALVVAAISQAVGLAVLLVVLPLTGGEPSLAALGWGLLAGIGGAGGLVAYFVALSTGPMGVTAPLAALVGTVVPVTVGLASGERPGALAAVGIGLGIAATVLASRPSVDSDAPTRPAAGASPALRRGIAAAILGGALFGLFFVALDAAPDAARLWPLLGARLAGLTLLGALLAVQRPARPGPGDTRIALLSGLLDMLANVFFLLATLQGLLVLVSVLTSLYPVGIVLLARRVLGERLGRVQSAGVALALGAVVLISI